MTQVPMDLSLLMIRVALVGAFGVQTVALHTHVPSQTRRLLFLLSFVFSVIPLNDAFAQLRIADSLGEAYRAQAGVILYTAFAVAWGLLTALSLGRSGEAQPIST